MKVKTTDIGGTVEILASKDFQAIPFTVTESDKVYAGQPMTLDGKKSEAGSANGVLLYDVDPNDNPNAALVVKGIIDGKKAAEHSGASIDADALQSAVPGIVVRENIGVNED